MWSRSTKQRRAAMRRRQKPLTFKAIDDALRTAFAGRDLSPLIYPHIPMFAEWSARLTDAPPKKPPAKKRGGK